MSEALKKAVGLLKLLNDELPTVEDSSFTPELAIDIIKMYGKAMQLIIDEHVKLLMMNQEAVEVIQVAISKDVFECQSLLQDWNEGAMTKLRKGWPITAPYIDHKLAAFAAGLPTCVKH